MKGRQAEPDRLFYDFCLDYHVPADHLLRQVNCFPDLECLRPEFAGLYSGVGGDPH